jgi:hypothetical protein
VICTAQGNQCSSEGRDKKCTDYFAAKQPLGELRRWEDDIIKMELE